MSPFKKTETDAGYLILDCLEEVIEYTLHIFWNISFLILGLGNVVCFLGDQRLPFQSNEG